MAVFDFSRRGHSPPNGFDLGDMRIEGGGGVATSVGHTPDQGMMIYVAMTELLDGLRRLLTTPRREFEFIGTDSSFRLLFRRVKIDRVDVTYRGIAIEQESLRHVARAALDGAVHLVSSAPLPPSDSVAGDISAAIAELRACLHE
jgi:hypothetical protein